MGRRRPPCCDESDLKKGPWTPEEDRKLVDYIKEHGHGSWRTLAKLAGLNRCGKSCRLRWANYLKPDIKRGRFTEDEERIMINLHAVLGNKWSKIASHLPGRTDNEIKNYWNTHLRKKLLQMGIDPSTHKPRNDFNHLMNLSQLLGLSNLSNPMNNIWVNSLSMQVMDITQVAKLQLLQTLLQTTNPNSFLNFGNPNLSLLANHSLNIPFQGLVNGTNTDLSICQRQQYADRGLFNLKHCSPQANTKSASGTDETNSLGLFAVRNSSSSSQGDIAVNNNSSTSQEDQSGFALPPLVSASSTTCSHSNRKESTGNPTQACTQSPSSSSVFEAWEKLMDDDTSGSYWKEILDLASPSPSPDRGLMVEELITD